MTALDDFIATLDDDDRYVDPDDWLPYSTLDDRDE